MTAIQPNGLGPGRSAALEANTPRLILHHRIFTNFHHPLFRISEVERKPVIVFMMDDEEVSLPLTGMMREFGISRSDPDGITLDMVGRALEFVTGMRIGDRMPSEILTGEASWSVDPSYRDRAIARLNLQLLAWMSGAVNSKTREALLQAGQTPINDEALADGLRRLSAQFNGISPTTALANIGSVAEAFAHIDSLRDQLLRAAQRFAIVLDRFARSFRGDASRRELLTQVRRLATIGIADLNARFDRADLLVADIEVVVGETDAVMARIQVARNDLYVRFRAWEPYLIEWGTIEAGHNPRTWHLAHDTYRFLAPRFMTIVEWMTAPDASAAARTGAGMTW